MSDSSDRSWAWGVLVVIGLGTLFTALNLEKPIVRNSLTYARAAENIVDHGYDARPVVADPSLSYDKPIAFAWLVAPLVDRYGTNVALKVGSFLGTLLYLIAVLYFLRAFDPFQLGRRERAWAVLLVFVNPLVIYQFWSAYPDTLFAALVLFALGTMHTMAIRPERASVARIVTLAALILLSIHVKYYGAILLVMCGVYGLWHVRGLLKKADRPWFRLGLFTACFVAVGGAVLLARWGHNPILSLSGRGGGVDSYGEGSLRASAKGAAVSAALCLLLNFNIGLLFALSLRNFSRRFLPMVICGAGIYLLGLAPFPGTTYNMRYFTPLFPILAMAMVHGARSWNPSLRRGLAGVSLGVGAALVVVFNVADVHRHVERWIPRIDLGGRISLLDNLRMDVHRSREALLDLIDAEVPAGSTLYMVDMTYYGDSRHGVYERSGLIRSDIKTVYLASNVELPQPDSAYFVLETPQTDLTSLGDVTNFGRGLFRVAARD